MRGTVGPSDHSTWMPRSWSRSASMRLIYYKREVDSLIVASIIRYERITNIFC